MPQRIHQTHLRARPLARVLARQLAFDPIPLIARQPTRVARPVAEEEIAHRSGEHRRNAFENEQPAPTRQTAPCDLQQHRRDRGSDQLRERARGHEHCHCFRAVFSPVPMAEVGDDARKKSRLGDAKQDAHGVKLGRGVNQTGSRRHASPHQHRDRDRLASAPTVDEHRPRNAKERVAGEENPGAKAENGVREMQLRRHLQTGETDVDAVDVGDDVEQEEKRHQSPRDAAHGPF
jgi:hypothetical protein